MAGEICCQIDVHSVTKSFPSPGISFSQPPPHQPEISRISVTNALDGQLNSSCNEQAACKRLKDIHMPGRLMEDFLNAASDNTNKNLETCGVLGAFLKDGTFYVTTLIIPKQEATSNSCQALNEEEIYAIQNEESLFPIGWIHTHPSQSCFMSSIDLHTQYTYQVMVPEAVGIVMAPTDQSRSTKFVIIVALYKWTTSVFLLNIRSFIRLIFLNYCVRQEIWNIQTVLARWNEHSERMPREGLSSPHRTS